MHGRRVSDTDVCKREEMNMEQGWMIMTCNDDGMKIDIHCINSDFIECLDAQIELNKGERRMLHYSIRQCLKILEECGGFVDIDNISPELTRKYKIMDTLKQWSDFKRMTKARIPELDRKIAEAKLELHK